MQGHSVDDSLLLPRLPKLPSQWYSNGLFNFGNQINGVESEHTCNIGTSQGYSVDKYSALQRHLKISIFFYRLPMNPGWKQDESRLFFKHQNKDVGRCSCSFLSPMTE